MSSLPQLRMRLVVGTLLVKKNTVQDYAYKFMYNQLGLNTKVSHFVPNHPRTCTFCLLINDNHLFYETFLQLFYECQTTALLHEKLISKYFSSLRNGLRENMFLVLRRDRRLYKPICYNRCFLLSFSIVEHETEEKYCALFYT